MNDATLQAFRNAAESMGINPFPEIRDDAGVPEFEFDVCFSVGTNDRMKSRKVWATSIEEAAIRFCDDRGWPLDWSLCYSADRTVGLTTFNLPTGRVLITVARAN